MNVLALVDGEHHPSVTRWAIEAAGRDGLTVVAALLVGGAEKLGPDRDLDFGGDPLLRSGGDLTEALGAALDEVRPEAVLDLSDEPVLGIRAPDGAGLGHARARRAVPGSRLPARPAGHGAGRCRRADGRRDRERASGSARPRSAAIWPGSPSAAGHRPVIVAMGRGGPPEPEVAGPDDVTLDALLGPRRRAGEHAASDYLEDALTRRRDHRRRPAVSAAASAGGRSPRTSPRPRDLAARLGGRSVILEGSGSALPDASPGTPGSSSLPRVAPPSTSDRLSGAASRIAIGPRGPYHWVWVRTGPENLSALDSHVRRLRPDVRVAVAELQPVPLGERERQGCVLRHHGAARQAAERLGEAPRTDRGVPRGEPCPRTSRIRRACERRPARRPRRSTSC